MKQPLVSFDARHESQYPHDLVDITIGDCVLVLYDESKGVVGWLSSFLLHLVEFRSS
jgi:hypothetical protein